MHNGKDDGEKIIIQERIGLMKHCGTVSLAAMLYVSAHFENIWAYKSILIILLVSMGASFMACLFYVANIGHKKYPQELRILRVSVFLSVVGLCVGMILLVISILVATA